VPVQIYQDKGVMFEVFFGNISLIDLQMAIQAKNAILPSYLLSDFSEAIFEVPLEVLNQVVEEDQRRQDIEKYAIVVKDASCNNYGNARMYQYLSEGLKWETRIFFEKESAVGWLQGHLSAAVSPF